MGQKNQDFKLLDRNSSMRWLIRAPNWLGDWVMGLPFFSFLRTHQPNAHIGVIVKESLYPLSCAYLPVNECYSYSKRDHKGLRGIRHFVRPLRGLYDVYVSMPPSFSSAWMGFCSGAWHRIGYRGDLRSFLLTQSLRLPKDTHRTTDYLSLLTHSFNTLGLPFTPWVPSAPRMDTNASAVESFSKDKLLVVSLHAEGASRTMPLKAAITLLRQLVRCLPAQLCFVGTNAQQLYYQELRTALGPKANILDMSGKTSLEGLVHWLVRARLVLATDSGTAHLAHALGTPTLVLFGAGNERKTAPAAGQKDAKLRLLRAPHIYCAPCEKNDCRFHDTHCLKHITPKAISNAAQELWHAYS